MGRRGEAPLDPPYTSWKSFVAPHAPYQTPAGPATTARTDQRYVCPLVRSVPGVHAWSRATSCRNRFVVPADRHLDLRAVGKRTTLAQQAEAERATGYVVGGISPLGQRRRLPTTVDESALGWDTILVSAGKRGLQIELAPNDLVRLTNATVAAVAA